MRTLEADPLLQIVRSYHEQPSDDTTTIASAQDVTQIIEDAKANYNRGDSHQPWGEMTHVAFIPSVILWKLRREGILDDPVAFKRWLNDPDNRMFRTRPGRV